MTYAKPFLTYAQQLALLKSRGVSCVDDDAAIRVLAANGYYNVSGYVYPFRTLDPAGTGRLDQVRPGTRFEDVAQLIDFDRDLRALLLKGIQIVEVSVRARIAYVLGRRDPFGHVTKSSLNQTACGRTYTRHGSTNTAFDWWQLEYQRLQRQATQEPFVEHNMTKYGPPLPIWVACEFLDFGATSNLYQLLVEADQQEIAATVGLRHQTVLASWLRSLNTARNTCAHNGRLWNRVFALKPTLNPRALPNELQHLSRASQNKVYPMLAITAWLTRNLNPDAAWHTDVAHLLRRYPVISGRSIAEMGTPATWAHQDLWK